MLKGDYVLLEDVKELFCWPNQPFWGQICDGDKIRTPVLTWNTITPSHNR